MNSDSKWRFMLEKCRILITKDTGLEYQSVDRAIKRMIQKDFDRDKKLAAAYSPKKSDFLTNIERTRTASRHKWNSPTDTHEWNRANEWHMEMNEILGAFEKYGPNWLRYHPFAWSVLRFDKGHCVDYTWPHRKKYVSEFGFI